jgi:hypothetical protein
MLSNPLVRQSSLLTTLEEICFHTQTPFSLEEKDIYPFICEIKLQVKTLLAQDLTLCYKTLISN